MRTAVAAVLATMLIGCGSQATPPEPTPKAATAAPAPSGPAEPGDDVALVAAGAEPRAPLRYAVPDGTIRNVHWKTQVSGQTLTLDWRYDVHRRGDGMQLTMRVLTEGALVRSEGQWTFSDRGRHAAATADARAVLQQTQAEHMLPILPGQQVGVGAQWTVPTSISAGVGVGEMPGHTRWELVALDGSVATVRGTLDAPETSLPFRDTVMKVSAKAAIDARIDLQAFTGDATMRLTMSVAGTPSESTTTMQVR